MTIENTRFESFGEGNEDIFARLTGPNLVCTIVTFGNIDSFDGNVVKVYSKGDGDLIEDDYLVFVYGPVLSQMVSNGTIDYFMQMVVTALAQHTSVDDILKDIRDELP